MNPRDAAHTVDLVGALREAVAAARERRLGEKAPDRTEFAEARAAGLVKRHETREATQVMRQPWIAQPDDLIGGWCVTLAIPATPAQGNQPIAAFVFQEVAEYIARIHNAHLGRFGLGSNEEGS